MARRLGAGSRKWAYVMDIGNHTGRGWRAVASRAIRAVPRVFLSAVVLRRTCAAVVGAALAGCSMSGGAGSLLVDPSLYSAYHCNDLATQWKVLVAREKELRALMQRADQGTGGSVIGSLAYGADYDSVLSEEKLLQRTAAEKKCAATPQFQSDQIIR
ncbi:MAG: hypothetical protein WBD53_15480 [Xanthobacteraceae bacterium]